MLKLLFDSININQLEDFQNSVNELISTFFRLYDYFFSIVIEIFLL